MGERITIELGALADPITKQPVAKYLTADDADHFERDNDAISRLRLRGLIPDSAATKARDKLTRNIVKAAGLKPTK